MRRNLAAEQRGKNRLIPKIKKVQRKVMAVFFWELPRL
jgi:hypothetical protein